MAADSSGLKPSSDPKPPASGDVDAWRIGPLDEVAQRLHSNVAHGHNTLAESQGRSALAILVQQFKSLIVLLLLAATGVAFTLGEWRFGGVALRLVRELELGIAGTAMVLDLLDEIALLNARLRRAGIR